MKKTIIIGIATFALVAIAVFNLTLNTQNARSSISFENIEALANIEVNPYLFCYKTLQYEEGAKTKKCVECVVYLNRSPAEQSDYGRCPN